MSTRGVIGIRVNGKDKVSYNHSDSYPDGLGEQFVAEVKKLSKLSLAVLTAQAVNLKVVNGQSKPTAADVKRLAAFTNLGVGNQSTDDWYCVLRDLQGKLKDSLDVGVIVDSSGFLKDSLFCEYAYILNLDDKTVEFYRGFNKRKGAPGRYAGTQNAYDPEMTKRHGGPNEYWGVELMGTCPMDKIPKNWIKKFYPVERED